MSTSNGKGNIKDIKDVSKEQKKEFIDELFNKKLKEWNEMEVVEGEDFIRLPEKEQVEFLNKTIVDAIKLALEEKREIRVNLDEGIIYIQK